MNHPNRSKTCRPREHLRAVAHFYPGAWKMIDTFRQNRGKGLLDWPQWCFCPLAAAYAIVSGGGDNRTPETISDVARIGALAAWRVTQGIYRFDTALYPQLIKTPINKLPVDVLYHLPEWCVYIETPDLKWLDIPMAGFFAHLEHDTNTGRPELRLLLDVDLEHGPALIGQPLHLTADTIEGAVAAMVDESKRQMINLTPCTKMPDMSKHLTPPLQQLLSLLLYLCSDSADFGGHPPPTNPRPKKIKKGWRLFPPNKPCLWDVGIRIGAALREAHIKEETGRPGQILESGRQRPRPHVRRAHWHLYWTGKGRQFPTVKWVPPVPINIASLNDLPATIRQIKN